MYKSIIFLLGLLTLLIPVGPSMSNSNVMAFEDYGYEADQYENYATDMANENYYKSHSDIIKKIKCNNINSNFNGVEDNIGTDDSLGGIGATSFLGDDASANTYGYGERNNGNFDLDCINNNNNEGGTGPAGPAGSNQILPVNLYYNLGNEVSILGFITGTPGNSTATCQPGDIAIGGNFDVISYIPLVGDPTAHVVILYDGNEGFDKYSTDVVLFGNANPLTFTTNVLCFDNPPLRTLATADVSAFQQPEDSPVLSQGIGNSPITSQVTVDSPELTATEKITKLKQQWLDLLP